MSRTLICGLVAVFALTCGLTAQCPGLHPTTGLTLNGTDPGTVAGNRVAAAAPYSLNLDVSDANGANMPLILLAGTGISCGFLPAGPTMSVDIGSPAILLDGTGTALGIAALAPLGMTPLSISIAIPISWQGTQSPSFQAIVLDPALGAIPFGSAAGGELDFQAITTTSYALLDDSSSQHTLSGAGVFFGGALQTSLYVGSNGVISFGAGVNDFSQSLVEHFGGWNLPPNPGISLLYTDLNRQLNGAPLNGATTDITEDLVTGDVTVAYNNQNWWGSQEPAGNFSVAFAGGAPLLTFDYTGLLGQVTGTSTFIIGVSDGDPTLGTDTDLSVTTGGAGLLASMGLYVSPGNDDSLAEEFVAADAAGIATVGIITMLDAATHSWTIF